MARDNSSSSGHARDHAQGMEVLRDSLLTQETALRVWIADSKHSNDILMRLRIDLMLWH